MTARIPDVRESLVHRFRRRQGEVRAKVVSVDRASRTIGVRMKGKVYPSLSAVAKAACGGTSQNGWVYWGLKKQTPRRTE